MGRLPLAIFLALSLFISASELVAIELECAPEGCGPEPGSAGYAGAVRARVIPQNSRGGNGLFGANAAGATENNLGSQSYNHAIPILHLPGRNGLNLTLTLHYNSRIWEIDRINGTAILNADRDFPSYGFRLDFGFLEFNDADNTFVLTEPDGSKRRLMPAGTNLYRTDDNSFILYDSANRIIRYKNGVQVQFAQFSGAVFANFYNPTLIQDTNGNRIVIAYNSNNRINTITDTLNRVVTYNYTNGLLTSITQGAKTWASFTWHENLSFTYNFTAGNFVVVAEDNTTGSPTQPAGSEIKVLASCTYPNGTGYRFNYGFEGGANADWGVVHKIENLSASQQVRSSIRFNFPSGSTSLNDAPTYNTQTVFDGVSDAVSEYEVTKNGSGLVTSYTVKQPNWDHRTKTVTTLFAAGDWRDGLVSKVEIRKVSDNTLLRTITSDWTADPSTNRNARVCRSTSTLHDTNPICNPKWSYSTPVKLRPA